MPTYQLHEPFPTLSSSRPTYMHTGRGGAGNLQRATPTDVAKRNPSTGSQSFGTMPPTSSSSSGASSSSSRSTFMSGRGGAGNAQPLSQRALFSFDEELERLGRMERDAAPVYHIGRGGAGNLVGSKRGTSDGGSDRKGSMSSEEGGNGPSRMSGEWLRRWRS